MAMAIRRKNIAAVQIRRKERKVARYIRGAFNAVLGLLAIVGFFAMPYLVEAFRPDVHSILGTARNLLP